MICFAIVTKPAAAVYVCVGLEYRHHTHTHTEVIKEQRCTAAHGRSDIFGNNWISGGRMEYVLESKFPQSQWVSFRVSDSSSLYKHE